MKRILLLLVSAILLSFTAKAQLEAHVEGLIGYYDVANWTQTATDGVIDLSNAPTLITFTSADNGSPEYTYMTIEAIADGVVELSWDYSTVDGPGWDYPVYVLNGVPAVFTSFDTGGPDTQSGVESFSVNKGDVFGFGVYTEDGALGSCTVDSFAFKLPVVPIALTSILSVFGLIAVGSVFRFRKRLFKK